MEMNIWSLIFEISGQRVLECIFAMDSLPVLLLRGPCLGVTGAAGGQTPREALVRVPPTPHKGSECPGRAVTRHQG